MGQQQLLLIVLGVIIVGVAIVAGIQLFGVGAEESAKDELVSHSLSIAANAQQWLKKPVSMGGGGGSFNGDPGATTPVTYTIPGKLATTTYGVYTGAIDSDTSYTITATPADNTGYTWDVTCTVTPNTMVTTVNP